MPRNLMSFHASIAAELTLTQDRVRNLIGDVHWQSDGEHKEAILRRILRANIAESYRIGKGFVCYPDTDHIDNRDTSRQIDILITKGCRPTLFRDGEFVVVTPDAVSAIIEVKTLRQIGELREDFERLASEKRRITSSGNLLCRAGLFVFNESTATDEDCLRAIKRAAGGDSLHAIDWVAIGPKRFLRFWQHSQHEVAGRVAGPAWHAYYLVDLAHAYFVSNVVLGLDSETPEEMHSLWFPIAGTKECHRSWYISLDEHAEPSRF